MSSSVDRMPSEEVDEFWLSAQREAGSAPPHGVNGGKWLVFVPASQVDEAWTEIKTATEQGMLGGSAKVATAKPNRLTIDPTKRVICVYTYDWTDEADVRRVRKKLRELGYTAKLPYKADADTKAGNYSNQGHRRISKYYE